MIEKMNERIETERLIIEKSGQNEVGEIRFGISLKENGEEVGGVELRSIDESNRSAEISFRTKSEQRGKSIAPEAGRRVIEYGFNVMDLNRIYGTCRADNPAGARVMQKLAMKHEATAREEIIIDGKGVDVEHFAILKSDPERKSAPVLRLETDRLILRTPEYEDIGRIVGPVNDEEISANSAHIPYPFTDEDAAKWYTGVCWTATAWGHVTLMITLKETRELIGSIWLRPDIRHKKTGIAYWVGREHWNKGYATEACERLIKFVFEDYGIERLTSTVIIGNDSSVQVAEKLGMEHESTTYKEWWREENSIDCHHYVLYKDKWEEKSG